MKIFNLLLIATTIIFSTYQNENNLNGESQYKPFKVDDVEFDIADIPWNVDSLGNHRAILNLKENIGEPIIVEIPWRRPDLFPETKKIRVFDAKSQQEIKQVAVLENISEKGEIAFKPNNGSSKYYIYFLPYKFRKGWDDARYGKPWNDYLQPTNDENSDLKHYLAKNSGKIPHMKVDKIESRTKFDFFTPMGIIATTEEQNKIKSKSNADFILFPEDRAFPIRPLKNIPVRWVGKNPKLEFIGFADKNEYYTWQIAVWATKSDLNDIKISFSDLVSKNGKINKEEITCFNQEGINWDGKKVNYKIDVKHNQIQPLWNGIQIPPNAAPGKYEGTVTLTAQNKKPQTIKFILNVSNKSLEDHGDSEVWRHSRLRWLNSSIGMDDMPVTPYQNMEVSENKVTASDKELILNPNGLPRQITINNKKILENPIQLRINLENKQIQFLAKDIQIKKNSQGLVSWTANSMQDDVSISCNAYMEYDGFINYNLKLSATKNIQVNNIELITDYAEESAIYFMGAGYKGGLIPENYSWDWKGPYDSYWIGSDKSGLHMEFRGSTYNGPLLNDYKPEPPLSWANQGKGRIILQKNGNTGKKIIAKIGEKTINNDTLNLEFALLITPVKPVNSKAHFSERYYHAKPDDFDKAATEGANIANIHHSQNLNPVINYPFIVQDSLIDFINKEHHNNRKVKLYYTIRELTNYTSEIYALKSLGHEIFVSGVGFGTPWQMEHLIDDYKPAWYTELPGQQADAALVLSGFSRWINYYLEGLRWMYENYKIDGIYMDDVSFDRTVMKRMRKISAKYRPGALVDLHSNTGYSIGPANQYTDFFPYVDRLWFGESFKYNEMTPDEWFVTFAGIPFGQMSEMLQDGGNRYLGMVYGATARHSYGKFSPAPIWKLWKDFGIEDAKMIGYWDDNHLVNTNKDLVKATVYLKKDKALIAFGNFDSVEHQVSLDINYEKMGFDSKKIEISAPYIENFQVEQKFQNNQSIKIKPKEGIILQIADKEM